MKSLQGMRIVEVGSVVLGPYGAEVLAEMGAEVIKIEALAGDSTRSMGAMLHSGMGSFFMACNRGKKSVAVNIGTPEGYEALCAIVRTADVFMHNVRFDSAERLGIGYEALSAINPRLVYCATYGYGARGRNARRAAYDDVIQAGCGLAELRGKIDGIPAYAPTILADKTTALFGVIGIMGALMERMQTGKGKQIEVAMLETMAYFISIEHLAGRTFDPPTGATGYVRLLSANRRPHRTKDGFLAVMPHNEKQWKKFFTLVGRHDILVDPRFAEPEARARNTDALYEEVGRILPTKTSAEWADIFTRNDVPYGPVLSLDDLIEDGHMQDVGFWHQFDHPTEGRVRVPAFPVRDGGPDGDATPVGIAPTLGQHSEEVLAQLGYPAEKIAALLREGVLVNSWDNRRKQPA
jgi:crotonobetainyl-CoA:carnitine CoA-transferase CaiB-like acyl-CoA transferase